MLKSMSFSSTAKSTNSIDKNRFAEQSKHRAKNCVLVLTKCGILLPHSKMKCMYVYSI